MRSIARRLIVLAIVGITVMALAAPAFGQGRPILPPGVPVACDALLKTAYHVLEDKRMGEKLRDIHDDACGAESG